VNLSFGDLMLALIAASLWLMFLFGANITGH
jgi:hypothetical protein